MIPPSRKEHCLVQIVCVDSLVYNGDHLYARLQGSLSIRVAMETTILLVALTLYQLMTPCFWAACYQLAQSILKQKWKYGPRKVSIAVCSYALLHEVIRAETV